MIPIFLTIQGIYSYQNKQTIDFSKLTEANIFGIFGPVGSGKSTILEAITFALYGKTDRLNLSGDNRNYNMMNLKSKELFIELIFKTGRSDFEYKTTVKGHRNKNNFDDVKTLDRAAYKKTGNEWEPIETDSLENIIGLSYENFKRTIIIPQNRFQEFLQLGNSDRTKMMKELFNLDKYELFSKVVSIETKNSQQLQIIEFQLQQIGDICPEQIDEKEKAFGLIKNEIKEKTGQLSLLHLQEERLRKLKELTGKVEESEQMLSILKVQESDFVFLEKTVGAFEYCLLNFKSLFESIKEINENIIFYRENIKKDNTLLANTVQQLSLIEKKFQTLKTAFGNKETLKLQAIELEKIIKIHKLTEICKKLNERILNGEKAYNNTLKQINDLTRSQESSTKAIKEIKDKMPDMVLLSEAKNWFTYQKSLVQWQNEIHIELKAIQDDLLNIEKQKIKLIENDYFRSLHISEDYNEIEATLNNKRKDLKLYILKLGDESEHLSVQSKLEEYATNLEEGKPCPLCGALSHPRPKFAQSITETLKKIREQKANTENEINNLDRIQKQLSEIITTFQLKKELEKKAIIKKDALENKIIASQKLYHWDIYKNESAVSAAFALVEKLQKQFKVLEEEQLRISHNLIIENQNKDKYHSAVEDFRHLFTANTTETTTLLDQIQILHFEDYGNLSVLDIDMLKESYLQKYYEIENAYNTANNKINFLRENKSTLSGKLEANLKTLDQIILSKNSTDNLIQEKLYHSGYTTLSQIENVLAQPMDIELEKKKISRFKESMNILEKQLIELKAEIGDQKYDEDFYQQIQLSIRQISEDINLMNQQQGIYENKLKKMEEDLKTKNELVKNVTLLRSKAEDIKSMKQLFKGSGFVNYISSVYLQELCHAANNRFYKLTKQRMSLEITNDNNFQILDFMNGGKTRSVKTLSGGQIFQAALSLALALADNIQKITESKQNFFFIDEGFGSLDKESLDIVFDTLKSLRKESRIVGIISHVEEMQQEIDMHLKIVNNEEKGSTIECSWKQTTSS
jgi:DNA repair protein SbcC/Rad50